MSGLNRREGIAFIISLMLVVVVYSNVMISDEYIIESNNPALTSQLDNTPDLHAVSDWGGLGSTSACQVHDSDQSVDENIGSSATFQMSETPSSSSTCYLGINLQYNYKVVNGSIIKPSYFDIEIEYSRSMPFEENCAWFSILAVNGHANPAQGSIIESYDRDQDGDHYWIGSGSCNGGPGDQRAPLPSSPITTDMRDDSSHLNGYRDSQYSGFTVEITVNPWYEPQFNMYIKEVRIIPSNTCLNDSDCDGVSDSEEDDDGDGVSNLDDDCTNTETGQLVDDSGCSDYQRDSDNDGIFDINDQCENTPITEINNVNSFGCSASEWDSDLDGVFDDDDAFPNDQLEWTDTDGDDIGDNTDTDDDGDGFLDTFEIDCGSNSLDSQGQPTDFDSDGICDLQDNDNDNDGTIDVDDDFPLDPSEQIDLDGDGVGDNSDQDDDGDGWSDEIEITCMNAGGLGDPKNANIQPIDNETETGPDGLYGTNDDIVLGDGLCNAIDQDDDNDGYNDEEDRFDWDPAEWFDYDLDGIGDNTDTDDDGDGWLDEIEIQCQTNQLSELSIPRDTDNDEECDYVDADDDGDGVKDVNDQCPDSIDIENINSVGCGKDDVGVFQTLSDTLIGRIGTSWQMFAFGVMILCFVGAVQIVRPRKKNVEIDEKFDVGDEVLEKVAHQQAIIGAFFAEEERQSKIIQTLQEQALTKSAQLEGDSTWSELRFSAKLLHPTKFGEIYVRLLTEYHSDYIDNGKFSNSKEREIVTALLRHAVEVEETFRSKSQGNWDEGGVGEKSAAVIIKRLIQRRGKKENKKSLFDEWGWTEAKIPNPEGLIHILNGTMHKEDDHDVDIEWTNNYSEVLADLIKNIIIGAKLKK